MFLTDKELLKLTGYTQPSKQSDYLTSRRIPHTISEGRKKEVCLTWEMIHDALMGKRGPEIVEEGKGFNLAGAR